MKVLRLVFGLALASLALTSAASASQGCTPYLCYLDLAQGAFICPNQTVYPHVQVNPTVNTEYNLECDTTCWHAAVVTVEVPQECTGVAVWVEYDGEPEGWTVDIGDSPTDNGFGGDAGSQPAGQNAEVQVLDNILSVFGAASVAGGVEQLASQHLALDDGALRFVAQNQFLSWGQPFSSLESPSQERLFFLPDNPVAPANRTLYVGLNRVISPVAGQNTSRNGCGLRRAIITVR